MRPKGDRPHVLLINPWVRDFKCYDEWMEPVGLLWIAAFLKPLGVETSLIDCLDRYPGHDSIKRGKDKKHATGDFSRVELEKPPLYQGIPRKYKQYGVSEALFEELLSRHSRPDLILMGSGMTYWCDGIARTAELTRKAFPSVPLFLGGVCATLCSGHAGSITGVDQLLAGRFGEDHLREICDALELSTPVSFPEFADWPEPEYELLNRELKHRAIFSTSGCPFHCTYCASRKLAPVYERRPAEGVAAQILELYNQGIRDFAFYDDALLFDYEHHLGPILSALEGQSIKARFHTPNGLHARWLTSENAKTLKRSGFTTLRIGFETDKAPIQKATGGKVRTDEMDQSLAYLREAGFEKHQIGVYIMVGMEGEPWEETITRAHWIQERKARALPNFLSPVPFTKEFDELSIMHPVLREDPRSHNDLFFAFYLGLVDGESFNKLKRVVREGNL